MAAQIIVQWLTTRMDTVVLKASLVQEQEVAPMMMHWLRGGSNIFCAQMRMNAAMANRRLYSPALMAPKRKSPW